jgi:hypothetical protein
VSVPTVRGATWRAAAVHPAPTVAHRWRAAMAPHTGQSTASR